MPIIKSAKKRVRQAEATRERNRQYKTKMLTMIKNIVSLVASGDGEKAKAIVDDAQKAIDTAAKKKIIHKKNAGHKKSRIARAIASLTA